MLEMALTKFTALDKILKIKELCLNLTHIEVDI
jgi:hypothetical protein